MQTCSPGMDQGKLCQSHSCSGMGTDIAVADDHFILLVIIPNPTHKDVFRRSYNGPSLVAASMDT